MKTMQRFLIIALLLLIFAPQQSLRAQSATCHSPQFFCDDTTFAYDYNAIGGRDPGCQFTPLYLWFWFEVRDTITSITVTCPDNMQGDTLWGPLGSSLLQPCDLVGLTSPITQSSTATTGSYTLNNGTYLLPGYYYLRVKMVECASSISFDVNGGELECDAIPCEDCIGSFAPEPGKTYLLSAWAKENNAPPTKLSYNKPKIYIDFPGSGSIGPFAPAGQIIDGWQRIESEFTVPFMAHAINIRLESDSSDVYFDDIRVFPYDGSMKTYVYDPITLRLVAELDERNYATVYEYDEEGKLLRVKKETERGMMTIQESKSSIRKQ